MRSGEGRINKLYPALTAKERAILVLRAWKEDADEDPLVRLTMPAAQVSEFNRVIGLMNGANCHLGVYMVVLRTAVSTLSAKLGWLLSLHLWGMDAWNVAAYLFFNTREPVTESEHRSLTEKARTELVPVKELAEILVKRYGGWKQADYQQDETSGEPEVSDRAWNRVLAEKERELAELVSCGTLAGKRRGRRLFVEADSFYHWLGEQVPVYPDWAKREAVEGSVTLYFVVRPDGSVKENVLVQKTAGFEDFDESARTALRAWRFEPLHGGRTGEQWGTITFHFRLREAG